MSKTLKIVSPALIFFSLNKVLLSFVNGQERLKLFAIGNILRYIFMLASLLLLIYFKRVISDIAYIFLIAEILVTVYCIGITIKSIKFSNINLIIVKSVNHIKFGARALLSGISVELNSRADVVILGIFTSDSIVGVYSFFALVAEGLYNIFVVIKNIFNPKITKFIKQKDSIALKTLIKKIQKIVYPSSFAIALIVSIGIYVIVSVIPDSNLYYENFAVLIILISSIVIISGVIPFEIILTLGGRPGLQSIQTFITLAFNVILNFILIPYFGALGAALATASSYIIGAILLNQFSLRSIGVKIL
jgi:O-antigen/teichoic acid export membrane protein